MSLNMISISKGSITTQVCTESQLNLLVASGVNGTMPTRSAKCHRQNKGALPQLETSHVLAVRLCYGQ